MLWPITPRLAGLWALILGCLAGVSGVSAAAGGVVVLLSHETPPYQEVLAGFREHLGSTAAGQGIEVVALGGDPEKAGRAVREAVTAGARVLLAVGSVAADAAGSQTAVPVVVTLVLDPGSARRGPKTTGVSLAISPEVQLDWMKRMLPGRKRVGLLYTPGESGKTVEAARAAALEAGLELVTQEVRSPTDLPGALDVVGRRADVLWGIPDRGVYTAQTAKAILLFSFRNRVPLVGLSEAWVKAGALYALEPDYRDVGAQSAELAGRILSRPGQPPPPPAAPRSPRLSVNLKAARQMKIDVPEALVKSAHSVQE